MNIDVTCFYGGFHGDCSETHLVGDVDERGKQPMRVTPTPTATATATAPPPLAVAVAVAVAGWGIWPPWDSGRKQGF